ncbi:MAG: ABC transporter permease [Gemmatimonadota bacterium]
MEALLKDIRYGARMLIKNPGLAAISVLALALGIGLSTTMFSIVYGALYRGLPFEDSYELMHLERNNLSEDIESMEVTIHDFVDWREQQTSFEDIAGYYQGTVNVTGSEGLPHRYDGAFMSANAFGILQQQPALGRGFVDGDDGPGAPPTIILGFATWRDQYGSDASIVGRTVRVNGEPATVIGVMPEGFEFPIAEEVWVPLRLDPLELERGDGTTLEVFGRLKDGVSLDMATAEFGAIAKRLALEYPESNEGVGASIKPFTEEYIGEEPTRLLWVMMTAVFLVLIIACVNVANLLLARAAVRTREIAVRTALGASRGRVITQLLTESFVLTLVGGVIGLGLGWVGVRAFNAAIVSTDPPFWIDIKIDIVAATFVIGLVFGASLLAGIFPALQASGTNVNDVLKDESRGSSSLRMGRFSRALIVVEVALACGLLAVAGLTTKSVVKLKNIDYAFELDDVFTARLGLFETDYPDDAARVRFFEELQERVAAIPGVRSAAVAATLPGGLNSWGGRFAVEGETYDRDQDYPATRQAVISTDYFETFGVRLLRGREFTVQDNADGLQVVIVNQSFANRFFQGEEAIGARLRLGTSETEEPWLTIVGVAPDLHMDGPENEEPWGIYVPITQTVPRFAFIVAQTDGAPMAVTPQVRDAVLAIDQNLPLYWVRTLREGIYQNVWFYYVFGTLFMIFGGVALFLATVGLYGVMSFSVSRRTKEVGVRMALGAEGADVVRMVLRQGLLLIGIGLLFGLLIAVGLGYLLGGLILFDVEPFDLTNLALIALVLTATSMVASFIPARRATRVNPVVALRYE